ncbi:DNA sulfur modification protein DndB [Clostridium coskatii]|uniref:DGQHR domain protein n=1 Tax=Clostridium coskatii TaxID=1705578 RepID=A0A168NFK2_9CLOT|nr:DNA sulfur modification protein DndB [Clostridium coskatii]OAA86349.1 hypothetical protein WX73_02843 [Clostridium coskatii]OAA86367.1 hypothetical protein WX73_02861 [Clostridium coskatii]OBR95066.1 hypothetical protein CLCOS_17710 [Clostridium coskatii]
MSQFEMDQMNFGVSTASLNVPALQYLSGERIWFAVTIPYKTLGKFIQTSGIKNKNKDIIGKDIRNRFLDTKHKNDIKNYINIENQYTIPPITLVSPQKLDFRPYTFKGCAPKLEDAGSRAGIILLPIDYEFECLDGNHRTAAIRELASENPELIANSNMLLNIVVEDNPKKIRQDFVDVNKNAKPTTSSINTLFNTRDPLSSLVNDIVVDSLFEEINYLSETTELLSTSVSKKSKNIYTINNIKNAVIEISGYNSQSSGSDKLSEKLSDDKCYRDIQKKVVKFFNALKDNNFIKNCLSNKDDIPNIRETNVLTSGTGIIVATRVAGYIFENFDESQIYNELLRLVHLDWTRKSPLFSSNIVVGDKILNSRQAIECAVNEIKNTLKYQ